MTILSKKQMDSILSKYVGKDITSDLKSSLISDLNEMFEANIDHSRKYNKEVENNPDEVDIFTVDDWKQEVEDGMFRNDDGSGYWMKDGKKCADEVFSSPQLDATHVAWYNK